MALKKKNSNISQIANLITSALLYYPEIASINLEPKENLVVFNFYLKEVQEKGVFKFQKQLQQMLEAYYYLEQMDVQVSAINHHSLDFLTTIEVKRDLESITQKEIALLVAVLKEEFGISLVTEEDAELALEDYAVNEELIGYILEHAKESKTNISLIALRDEGRVLVFNK